MVMFLIFKLSLIYLLIFKLSLAWFNLSRRWWFITCLCIRGP